MRSLFTLLFLCIFSMSAHAWNGQLYLLGGVGKSIQNERMGFSGNFGLGSSSRAEYSYFNAGVSLYYLNSIYQNSYRGTFYGSKTASENFIFEFAVGGGYCTSAGKTTFRIGPDVGMNFSLSTGNMHVAIIPKAMLSFDVGGSEIGFMVKSNFPLFMVSANNTAYGRTYSPGFIGGGVVLDF